ncbi:hypothetical protein CORC01_01340 [Colletotrichum orchidophilum]|uniref:Uncharacterized protein n=1 Tax=Colletotrichum orchidophilum TaxID=1209926 RepID=A0A1G4BPP3_9PEZI|nr:uncharacterized protein CORC01_01340 [Colletotrichum orchidophilum]OHF03287.1 hypothetical protein CORC01_01340 [Colletotrichum orchidophilum]
MLDSSVTRHPRETSGSWKHTPCRSSNSAPRRIVRAAGKEHDPDTQVFRGKGHGHSQCYILGRFGEGRWARVGDAKSR